MRLIPSRRWRPYPCRDRGGLYPIIARYTNHCAPTETTAGADYYISIHCNAHSTATARGVEAFAYSAGGEGYALGSLIVDSLVAATGFPKRGMKVSDYYWVLRGTAMPAVLVEMAFITHAEEAALLDSNPDLFANAIAAGILAYFE